MLSSIFGPSLATSSGVMTYGSRGVLVEFSPSREAETVAREITEVKVSKVLNIIVLRWCPLGASEALFRNGGSANVVRPIKSGYYNKQQI